MALLTPDEMLAEIERQASEVGNPTHWAYANRLCAANVTLLLRIRNPPSAGIARGAGYKRVVAYTNGNEVISLDEMRAKLREHSKAAGSQSKLADALGWDQPAMSAFIHGRLDYVSTRFLDFIGYKRILRYEKIS